MRITSALDHFRWIAVVRGPSAQKQIRFTGVVLRHLKAGQNDAASGKQKELLNCGFLR